MTESLLYFHVVVKVDIQRIDERKEDKFDALIKDNHDIDRILGLDRTWPLTPMAIAFQCLSLRRNKKKNRKGLLAFDRRDVFLPNYGRK